VLVVEPDDATRSLYRETLRPVRCDVVEASDGRDALTKALVHAPSLVVTELRLAYVDGFALCEILRRDRTTANVPILIVTAESRLSELNRARRLADAVLVKPTRPDMVLDEIERLTAPTERREQPIAIRANPANGSPQGQRKVLAKAHSRATTTTPPTPPPTLKCPSCDRRLAYVQSHVGGVNERHSEQWDYFACSTCGAFQYRQRTRKLRPLRNDEAQWMQALRTSRS
jgi:CheY-like chemotaxis protein